jgi:hypothetical protein
MVKKLGYKHALEMTVEIARHLPNKQNVPLFKKSVQSIFDDQLQLHTWLNRSERRVKLKELNTKLKEILK